MGFMYNSGKGVKCDYLEAMRWLKLAVAQGDVTSLCHTGFMYEHGHGVEQDDARALFYYSKAARRGDVYAMKNREIIEARMSTPPQ